MVNAKRKSVLAGLGIKFDTLAKMGRVAEEDQAQLSLWIGGQSQETCACAERISFSHGSISTESATSTMIRAWRARAEERAMPRPP